MKNISTERTKLLDDGFRKRSPTRTKRKGLPDVYPSLSFFQLYKYSSTRDKVFIVIGIIVAIIAGVSYSFFTINLGNATSVIVSFAQIISHNPTGLDLKEAEYDLDSGVMEFVIVNCIIAGVIMICTYCSMLIFNYTALNQTFKMRELFLRNVLNQDIAWHDINQTGDFASRMSDDLKKIEEGIGEKVSMFLYYLTLFVSCITQAMILGWELTLICMLSLPLTTTAMTCVSYVSSKLAIKETNAYGAAGAIAEEVFSSIRTVVAFSGEKCEQGRYNKLLKFAYDNNVRRAIINGIGEGITWFISYSNYALGFWYGAHLIVRDRGVPIEEVVYDPGTMISIFFSVYSASWNFGMLSNYIEIFGVAKGAASKIFGLIESKPIINLSKGSGLRYGKVDGRIVFKDVHFEYPSRSDVKILKGLDLVINPGETVALVGSSGCGKSTCIQLIQRYYDPSFGSIYIDDYKLEDLDLTWIRSHIGVVGQEPVLFKATIAENIRLGCKTATMDDIEQAAKKANAHSFIQILPQGYNTLIGERGTQLSGGQKQRIAIARALVRKPSILLLDEATSALDTNSEAVVQAALEAASVECTTIIVAHRLSTVKKADRIVVISEGVVEEEGTHGELLAKKGTYYELITAQVSQDDMINEDDTLAPLTSDRSLERKDSIDSDSGKRPSLIASYIKEIIQEKNGSSTSIWEILRYNAPESWAIVVGCICAAITGASMPVFAILYGKVVGVFSIEDNNLLISKINVYSTCFLVMAFVIFIATFMQVYLFGYAGEKLTMRLRSMMFKSFLDQEIAYYDDKNHGVGSLCGLLAGEAASVQGATGHRIGTILSATSTVIIAVVASFYYEWRITLVVMCFSPVMILSVFFEKQMISKESRGHYDTLQTSTRIAVEAISGIRTVVYLGCEQTFHNLYMAEIVPYQKIAKCNAHFRGIIYAISRSLMLFAYSAAFYYGALLVKTEHLDYSVMFIVTMAVITSSWSLARGFAFTPNLQKGLIAAGRIIQAINRSPLIRDGSIDPYEKWRQANVEYDNVHFSYPTRPNIQVLRGLNLSVLQGKTVALVGPSGCGKSTIVQLLERFYDPISGTILVDNKPIDTIHLSALRSQMGIVSQEPVLFSRTIAENIAYGDNSRIVPKTEIIEAAKNANIHDFIVSLPLGYDTTLGEKGTQLSGGQKQRVAIARALVRNPRILLLDEATSALDAESEKVVQEALDKARMGRTCLTIAHRLSTIHDADIICVINRGRIAEMGSHHELLTLRGLYHDLHRLQH